MKTRETMANLFGILMLVTVCTVVTMMPARRAASASPAPPTPPPATGPSSHYSTRGKGAMTVDGPGCCGGIVFPSTFEMDYEADATGRVRISRLYSSLTDMDISFHFLIFETGRIQMRCGVARSVGAIEAWTDASGNLSIAPGAATLSGEAVKTRDSSGNCGGGQLQLTLTNNAPLFGVLDPAGNRVTLNGTFATTTEGRTYNISLEMIGEYANRPPVAVFGVQGTGLEAFAQGGCPAVFNYGNPSEYTVEANDPSGLKMHLQSFSRDPDGIWNAADVGFDQWFQSRNAESLRFIAEGRRIGPRLFEFGPVHHLMLETTDRLGVSDTTNCDFRVVDRTPPAVTAPGAIVIDATIAGGATSATSAALRAFLERASATDTVDISPKALSALLNGEGNQFGDPVPCFAETQ